MVGESYNEAIEYVRGGIERGDYFIADCMIDIIGMKEGLKDDSELIGFRRRFYDTLIEEKLSNALHYAMKKNKEKMEEEINHARGLALRIGEDIESSIKGVVNLYLFVT